MLYKLSIIEMHKQEYLYQETYKLLLKTEEGHNKKLEYYFCRISFTLSQLSANCTRL